MSYRVLNLRGKRLNEGFDYKEEFINNIAKILEEINKLY